MRMFPVSSRAILSVGYDPGTQLMKIQFVEGGIYDFCGVPQTVFEGLLRAESAGSYYNAHIRDNYQC